VVAAASRAYPGETENGDAWTVQWRGDLCRIAVVDGLGHGPPAAAAARLALDALNDRPALAPVEALAACHQALAGSRGAVLAVAEIDTVRRRLHYAGVGNIEGHFSGPNGVKHLMSDRGIVGSALPRLHPHDLELVAGWLLLLHSDGVRPRFDLRQERAHPGMTAQALADAVLASWGRPNDDATVVVIAPTGQVAGAERPARSVEADGER
jgi:serine phosphatase RsbU (regulator of sigma subunit)